MDTPTFTSNISFEGEATNPFESAEWIAKRREHLAAVAAANRHHLSMPFDRREVNRMAVALDALEAVLALHRLNREDDGACQGYTSSGYGYLDRWCVECSEQSGREYGTPYPCPTVAAVTGARRLRRHPRRPARAGRLRLRRPQ